MNDATAQKILSQEKNDYERIAPLFSNTRNRMWPEVIDLVDQYVVDGDNVLDVGCGNGRLYDLLKYRLVNFMGIDSCEYFIQFAKKKYQSLSKNVSFHVGDALTFPVKKNRYDVVFLLAVLNHFPTRELQLRALDNIFDSLKQGGKLIMTNWNLYRPTLREKSVWKFLFEKTLTTAKDFFDKYGIPKKELYFHDVITTWGKESNVGYLYYYAFTLRYLKKLVKKVGFSITDDFYVKMGKKCSFFSGYNLIIVAEKAKK